MEVTPDGRRAVSASEDHTLRVSTPRLYDRRRSRPEDSPTFRVAY